MTETNNPSGAAVDVLAPMDRACEVLAELYAKYQLKIGPFASQAQDANVKLRHARTAVAALIARNAEMEAERDAFRDMASSATGIASDLRGQKERLIAERDALAAENKALRECVDAAKTMREAVKARSEDDFGKRSVFEAADVAECAFDAALARTSAAAGGGNG